MKNGDAPPPPAVPEIHWFRQAAPYIRAHRGALCVLYLSGELIAAPCFHRTLHDIALLHALGMRLALVHGARPQVDAALRRAGGGEGRFVAGLRVTDDAALTALREAVAAIRVEIESRLPMGLANAPTGGARIRVLSGNLVAAQPLGVRDGVDFLHTGRVRRIDGEAVAELLKDDAIVLLSPLGHSPAGALFNLSAQEIAAETAIRLKAAKLLFCTAAPVATGQTDAQRRPIRQLSPRQAEEAISAHGAALPAQTRRALEIAARVCRAGVARAHLLDCRDDGALFAELFSRDGVGTMVTAGHYDALRPARVSDVGGILELIAPLEREGALTPRTRTQLELEIDRYTVMERDGAVIALAGLFPHPPERAAELAALIVHPDYRNEGRAQTLLEHCAATARADGVERLFVLTTQTAHWFLERGFAPLPIADLPEARRRSFSAQRNAQAFARAL